MMAARSFWSNFRRFLTNLSEFRQVFRSFFNVVSNLSAYCHTDDSLVLHTAQVNHSAICKNTMMFALTIGNIRHCLIGMASGSALAMLALGADVASAQINTDLPKLLPANAAENAPSTALSLTLQQALQIAVTDNRDIRLSRLALDTAGAMRTAAAAAPNPTLTIQTVNINPKLGIGSGKLRDKTVDSTWRIDQLIERGGKREYRSENARYLELAARHDATDTERQTRITVSAAYFDLLAAQQKLRLLQETRKLFGQTQAAADQRKKAGDIAGADAARIRVDALRSENDMRQAQADLLHAQSHLINLLSLRISPAALTATDNWPATTLPATLELENTLQQAIGSRPDVQSAQAKLDAALAAKKLALAARTRDVSVGVQFEHYPTSATNTQGSGNSYGVSVQIPLFARYEYQGEIRAAEIAVDSAREMLEKTREAAAQELRGLWESASSAQDILQRLTSQVQPAARQSADAAEFAFKNGALGVMDVLDARRVFRATEIDTINAQSDFAKAQTAWQISTQESKP